MKRRPIGVSGNRPALYLSEAHSPRGLQMQRSERLKKPSGGLSLQGVNGLIPDHCHHANVQYQCNIWPGMNLGINLTRVVCYWTPPDVGTQWPDNRRGILWSSASLSTTAENYTSYCTMEDCNKVQKILKKNQEPIIYCDAPAS